MVQQRQYSPYQQRSDGKLPGHAPFTVSHTYVYVQAGYGTTPLM